MGFEDLYTFLHLTFQEYLAAYHLFQMEEEEQLKQVGRAWREEAHANGVEVLIVA